MPKIIENLKEVLLFEAKKQIAERGYKATTVRSVAASCGVAVGTVYNYFSSKEMLVATFMLEDWLKCLDNIRSTPRDSEREYFHKIYAELLNFAGKYSEIFADEEAIKAYGNVSHSRHGQLRSQLAELILPICRGKDSFTAEFVAESMLTWSMAGIDFESIYAVIKKIII